MHYLLFLAFALSSGYGLFSFPALLLNPWALAGFLVLYSTVAFSFTAGYHRLWSHAAFKASKPLEALLYFFATAAFPGSLSVWSRAHAFHHDQVLKNPSSPSNSQLRQSQLWWTLLSDVSFKDLPPKTQAACAAPSAWIHKLDRLYPVLSLLSGLAVPTLLGTLLTGDAVASFFWFGCIRALLQTQVCGLLHTLPRLPFGRRPYSIDISVYDSVLLAVLSLGDGYQNFHHHFPADFRSGVRKYHWAPTKWLLRLLASVGLAHSLVATPRKDWMRARVVHGD